MLNNYETDIGGYKNIHAIFCVVFRNSREVPSDELCPVSQKNLKLRFSSNP